MAESFPPAAGALKEGMLYKQGMFSLLIAICGIVAL